MYICENTESIVKIGPIQSKDGKAFNRKRLFNKEVLFCINAGSLANFASGQDIPIDLDGYYNVKLPAMTPGNLKIVVQLEGYADHVFEFTVLSKHAYSRMFSNDMQKVTAVNVPIENGHVVHDPNMCVGIDFGKCLNLDAELAMPNTFLGGVGEVASPHVTDLTPVIEKINNHAFATDGRIDRLGTDLKALEEYLGKLDPMGENQRTTIQYMKELLVQTEQLEKAVGMLDTWIISDQLVDIVKRLVSAAQAAEDANVTADDIVEGMRESLAPLAKSGQLLGVATKLLEVESFMRDMKLITVEDITGGGALDTEGGRVRLMVGDGDGELELKDGLVRAYDVAQRGGYSLAKTGIDSIKSEIINLLKEQLAGLRECLMKEVKANKITKLNHHH